MAMRDEKMSCLLLFWLFFVLGNLLKNASRFVGCLTLLKKSDELERVRGHCLVCIRELKLICFGLREEDLFTLGLRCGYLHGSTEVASIKIADEMYLMPHELMHWHEGRLLGSTKPADQLVANIGEPGNCLKVVPDAFTKVRLRLVYVGGTLLGDDIFPFGQTYILKTLTHQVKQCSTIILLSI